MCARKYYSVLHSTTPVLLCTTKCYSSTTLYYKVLQRTTPYWKVLHEMSFTVRGATNVIVQPHQIPRLPRKMIAMMDPCHIWNVIYNARGIVQTHRILRLPRKVTLIIDPCHIWNAIYSARSNRCHCPTSPNTAPATQNDSPNFQLNVSNPNFQLN